MAITLVGTATNGATSSSLSATLSVNVPTGTVDGNVMILDVQVANAGSGAPTVATPAGWTLITSVNATYYNSYYQTTQYKFYRVASSEPSSYTLDITYNSTSYASCSAAITSRSGVDTTTPVDTYATSSPSTAVSSIGISLTATNANELFDLTVANFGAVSALTYTPPTNFTVEYQQYTANGGYGSEIAMMDDVMSSSGSTGTQTCSFTPTPTNCTAIGVLLNPAGGGSVALASDDTVSVTDSAALRSDAVLQEADQVKVQDSADLSVAGGTNVALGSNDPVKVVDSATLGVSSTTSFTVLDLILAALKLCGAIGVGQTVQATDTADALTLLQMMLAQWQSRRWLVYSLTDLSLTSTGAESYTLGSGGDFDTAWVPYISSAFCRQTLSDNPEAIDYPVRIIRAREDYNRITMKTLSTFPEYVFFDAQYPLGNVYFWAIPPSSQYEIHITVLTQLQSLSSLTQTLSLPPAYQEAIVQNLALRLRIYYQLPPDPVLKTLANVSLVTVKAASAQIPRLTMPDSIKSGGFYNMFSDDED